MSFEEKRKEKLHTLNCHNDWSNQESEIWLWGTDWAKQELEDTGFANIQKWMSGVERKRVRKLEYMNDKQVAVLQWAARHHQGHHSELGNKIRGVLREFGNLQGYREAEVQVGERNEAT